MKRKSSRQRDQILAYMMSVDGHLTAEEIFENLQGQGASISLATVYRNLGILEEMHKIKKIAHPVNGFCYDRSTLPHHHLHCVVCGGLYDLPFPYQKAFDRQLAKACDVEVYSHSITVEGVCADCRCKRKRMEGDENDGTERIKDGTKPDGGFCR